MRKEIHKVDFNAIHFINPVHFWSGVADWHRNPHTGFPFITFTLMSKETQINLMNETLNHFPVVGIGASAGGLDAFKELIHAIPQNPGMAFLLMQHLDPAYETVLAEILQRETMLPVVDLNDEIQLEPDHIYVIPASKLLLIKEGKLQLAKRPDNTISLHSIDIFFSALAETFQGNSRGILLSGMGSDGTLGLKHIKDHGGVTFVQTPASAKYPSMPQHALQAEVADFELKPSEIPKQLLKIDRTLKIIPGTEEDTPVQAADESHFKEILHLLRLRRNVDFTYYKQTTIRRRILRRMVVNKMEALSVYLEMLEQNPAEQDLLYQDLLIPVTSFFRDNTIFESLCKKVFPAIMQHKSGILPVRIWIAGCSTGEEAYSIAICLHEYLGEKIAGHKLQLFATDISEQAIQKARTGLYSKRDVSGISEKRLQEYFIKTEGEYMVKKNIRDLCVFATHNFLKDPPFAKMDFISCRNVLIYMERYLQRKALGIFHYALNEKGILLLGKSETAGNAPELFKVTGKIEKLYARMPLAGRSIRLLTERGERITKQPEREKQFMNSRKEDFQTNADNILLAKYSPAAVVVNEHFEIVQFKGSTGVFLEAAPGKASLNILKMAREGLSFEIRNALHKAREAKETVVKKNIPIGNGQTLVTIEVVPLLQSIEPHYLIIFKEELRAAPDTPGAAAATDENGTENSALHKRIKQLEKDLSQLREDMRTITEEQEAANEELQSANEELLSGSEELQSLNEEMETSKEELQSSNEELMTVNQEIFERNEQYNQARLYSEAIIATIREPLLVLNRDLRVKSANDAFYEIFGFKEEAISNKILFELEESKWDIPNLRTHLLKVQTAKVKQAEWEVEFTLSATDKRTMLLNASPVNSSNNEELILLAFKDITLIKNEARRLEGSANQLKKELAVIENFFLQAPALFCVLKGPEHTFEFVNPRYNDISGGSDLKGQIFANMFPELENEGYKKILDDVYLTGIPFLAREMKANHFPGSKNNNNIYVDLSCQPYRNDSGEIEGVMFFSYEVTEQVMGRRQVEKNAEELEGKVSERTSLLVAANMALARSNKNLQEFASIASHDLQEPLRKIKTFTSILNDKFSKTLPDAASVLIIKTQESANRMSALIKDVLNYSRVTVPDEGFVDTDVSGIIQNIIKDFDLLAEEKKAVINIQEGMPVIKAIPLQMNQLFYNLISNSLKFTSGDRLPVITISWRKLSNAEVQTIPALMNDKNYIEFLLKDNGIGFEQQFAEQIFSVFERLNTAKDYEGTGIGLALCRKILDNHHGVIRAKGEEGQGSSFFIIVPFEQ